jgi:hypothetical protein
MMDKIHEILALAPGIAFAFCFAIYFKTKNEPDGRVHKIVTYALIFGSIIIWAKGAASIFSYLGPDGSMVMSVIITFAGGTAFVVLSNELTECQQRIRRLEEQLQEATAAPSRSRHSRS